MLARFGHIGDVHIGALRRWAPVNQEYLKRQLHNLEDVVKKIIENKLDFVVFPGDFFDHSNISVHDLLAGAEFLRKVTAHCPVILSPGNHDEETKGRFVTDYLKALNIPNLQIVSKKQLMKLTVRNHTFNILATPWTGIKNEKELHDFLLSDILYGDTIDIVMLHECFMGSVLDNGRVMSGVKVPDIGAKYYACGDIHKYQKLNLPNAYFSGSPMQVKTDDAAEKGFIIVDVMSEFDYQARFVKLENQIEIKQISSLDQITNEMHWYKLVCPINQKPAELPACVKDYGALPIEEDLFIKKENTKEGIEQVTSETRNEAMDIDYTFGVHDLLNDLVYSADEIAATKKEIEDFVVSQGA